MRHSVSPADSEYGFIRHVADGLTTLCKQRSCHLQLGFKVSDFISNGEAADYAYGSTYGHNPDDSFTLGDAVTPVPVDDDGATSIFVLQFAPHAFCGVQSMPITVERFVKLETKDASRVRIKWYPSIMLQSIISCAKVTGIDFDGVVAA